VTNPSQTEARTPSQINDVEALALGDVPVKAASPKRVRRRVPLSSYPATYLLMGINIAVFVVMFFYGPVPELIRQHAWGSIFTAPFDVDTLLRFGATASPLIQHGEWWRLVTGTFVHVTILHITLNLWCLWNLGLFGEPLLGKRGLVAVYLLTGTAGMMLSYAWSVLSGQVVLVAGASGAVFGIAGILIVLLSNRKLSLPWTELRSLRRQVIFFAVANLVIGMTPQMLGMASPSQLRLVHLNLEMLPRIDNTAHVGGFLSGLALGLPLFPRMMSGRDSYRARQRVTFVFATFLLCLFGYALSTFTHGKP
jgi:rhomboid protease GluP